MAHEGVLRTRLLPPRLPTDHVLRPDLTAAVAAGLQHRLVAVVAGAGYGKTTLLRLTLAESDAPWVWLSCDARLLDPRILLAHIAAGITERFPGFAAGLSLAGSPDDAIAELSNEILDTLPEPFVVAIDDVHLLPASAAAAVGGLVEQLPPNVHLALASRTPLPFGLGRLRVEPIVELDEGRLAFSIRETEDLVRSIGIDLSPDAVALLHGRTEGWPAGVILAAQFGSVPDAGTVTGAEFDYLAEEVMVQQPQDVQAFLRDTAVLGRFSPGLAEAVSGRADAGDLVRRLAAGHLFTTSLDENGEWYRYHHLFQRFLRGRLAHEDPERERVLHLRAAEWWRAAGEPAEAVPHLIAADDHDGAIAMLEPVAEHLALSPQAETMADWLATLPRERWSDRPGLLLAEATILLGSARHEAAFAEFDRAIERLLETGDHERAAAALFRLQQAMLTAGTSPTRRIEAGRRWRGRIAAESRLLPAARILLASALAYGCRFDEADEELAAALALPAAGGSTVLPLYAAIIHAFYIDFWRGDPRIALERLEAAQRALHARELDDELGFLPFAEMLRCYLLNELGRHDDALEAARRLHEELDLVGLARVIGRSRVWVDATAFAGLGRWDDLRAVLPAPTVPQAAAAPTSYAYRYRAPWALLAAEAGAVDDVRAQIDAAHEEMRAFGTVFDDASFLCSFAVAAARAGLGDAARRLSRDAVAAAGAIGSPWARACASAVAAYCHLDDASSADDDLAQALHLTARSGLDELWSRRYRALAPTLLAAAIVRSLGPPGEAERLLAVCGAEVFAAALAQVGDESPSVRARLAVAAGAVADIDLSLIDRLLRDRDPAVRDEARRSWSRLKARPRAEIGVLTLGELVVLRDGVPVPSTAFVRQKARALLAALIAAGAPVHRETLSEWLWSDLTPERAAAALRSTLHDLRRAVTPELESGDPSSPIVTDGDTVRFVLAERDTWDAGEILALAYDPASGSPAMGTGPEDGLAHIERLYRGSFLAEWPFEDWAMARRVEIDEAFTSLVAGFAAALVAAGRPGHAVGRYRRLLQMEPERESWHRDLMRAHAAAGERALALRQYHACRTILRRQQGIEPDAETRALYRALLQEA